MGGYFICLFLCLRFLRSQDLIWLLILCFFFLRKFTLISNLLFCQKFCLNSCWCFLIFIVFSWNCNSILFCLSLFNSLFFINLIILLHFIFRYIRIVLNPPIISYWCACFDLISLENFKIAKSYTFGNYFTCATHTDIFLTFLFEFPVIDNWQYISKQNNHQWNVIEP